MPFRNVSVKYIHRLSWSNRGGGGKKGGSAKLFRKKTATTFFKSCVRHWEKEGNQSDSKYRLLKIKERRTVFLPAGKLAVTLTCP